MEENKEKEKDKELTLLDKVKKKTQSKIKFLIYLKYSIR